MRTRVLADFEARWCMRSVQFWKYQDCILIPFSATRYFVETLSFRSRYFLIPILPLLFVRELGWTERTIQCHQRRRNSHRYNAGLHGWRPVRKTVWRQSNHHWCGVFNRSHYRHLGGKWISMEQWTVYDDCMEPADVCLGHGIDQYLFPHDANYMGWGWRDSIHWIHGDDESLRYHWLPINSATRSTVWLLHPVLHRSIAWTVVILGAMFIDPEETRREMAK